MFTAKTKIVGCMPDGATCEANKTDIVRYHFSMVAPKANVTATDCEYSITNMKIKNF